MRKLQKGDHVRFKLKRDEPARYGRIVWKVSYMIGIDTFGHRPERFILDTRKEGPEIKAVVAT